MTGLLARFPLKAQAAENPLVRAARASCCGRRACWPRCRATTRRPRRCTRRAWRSAGRSANQEPSSTRWRAGHGRLFEGDHAARRARYLEEALAVARDLGDPRTWRWRSMRWAISRTSWATWPPPAPTTRRAWRSCRPTRRCTDRCSRSPPSRWTRAVDEAEATGDRGADAVSAAGQPCTSRRSRWRRSAASPWHAATTRRPATTSARASPSSTSTATCPASPRSWSGSRAGGGRRSSWQARSGSPGRRTPCASAAAGRLRRARGPGSSGSLEPVAPRPARGRGRRSVAGRPRARPGRSGRGGVGHHRARPDRDASLPRRQASTDGRVASSPDAARAGGRRADRARPDQPPDRRGARHHRGHGRQPRRPHPEQARLQLSGAGRRLGRRAGPARRS